MKVKLGFRVALLIGMAHPFPVVQAARSEPRYDERRAIPQVKVVPPARFQRATSRLGVSPRVFTCLISVYHKLLNRSIFID